MSQLIHTVLKTCPGETATAAASFTDERQAKLYLDAMCDELAPDCLSGRKGNIVYELDENWLDLEGLI